LSKSRIETFPRHSGRSGWIRREVKTLILTCPVLFAAACGGGGGDPDPVTPETITESSIQPGAPAVFMVSAAPPDTMPLFWSVPGPVGEVRPRVSPGDEVEAGDTLATGRDSMSMMELERSRMALAIAQARFDVSPGDTSLAVILAEESARCAALDSASRLVLTAPVAGLVVSVPRPVPGGPVVLILTGIDSLVALTAPPGAGMLRWPESAGPLRLVETGDDCAIYSGLSTDSLFAFPGSFSIPRQALRTSGLASYLVLEDGDSLAIEVICTMGATLTVTGALPADSRIRVWAGP